MRVLGVGRGNEGRTAGLYIPMRAPREKEPRSKQTSVANIPEPYLASQYSKVAE